jgi:hypothetical protein
MADAVIKALTGTISDDALSGPCQVWGVSLSGSSSTTAIITLNDNISTSATVALVKLQTNATHGGPVSTFEKEITIIFPRPVRFSSALSVGASAGVESYRIYTGGR